MDILHLFLHSSVDGYVGGSHLLAVVTSAAMNLNVQVFVFLEYLFSVLLGIHLGVGLLGHMVILCLTF